MPNLCTNRLTVTADPAALASFVRQALGVTDLEEFSPLSFHSLVPEPEHEHPDDWFKWRFENWGTKWDADVQRFEFDWNEVTYEFMTTWNPPRPWLEQVAPQFPELEFELSYFDDGTDVYGKLIASQGSVQVVCDEHTGEPLMDFLRAEFPDHLDGRGKAGEDL